MLESFLLKVVYVFILGLLLAIIEIQIEGKAGWASELPTWRPHSKSKLGHWYHKLTKKELTGYHLALNPFLFLFFHFPFIWTWTWSWQAELETLAVFAFFTAFWDFLWFVLNAHYSLHTFGPKQVWWHKHWLGKFPVDYYFSIGATIALFIPLIIADPLTNLLKLLILLVGVVVLTIMTILVYPKSY